MDIDTIRASYGYGTVEYTPVTFFLMCETLKLYEKWTTVPTTIKKLKCFDDYRNYKYMISPNDVDKYFGPDDTSSLWISEYIFSLDINSNGLKINWNEEGILPKDVADKYLKIDENIYLQSMERYSEYTNSFRERIKIGKFGILLIVVIFIILIFTSMKFLIGFIFLAAIISFFVTFSVFNYN